MKVLLASDHAGYELKEFLKEKLSSYELKDLGTYSSESVHYPEYAGKLAQEISSAENTENILGILICGSGIGVSIMANRYPLVRAALCRSEEDARLSRQHNHANVICLGARFTSPEEAMRLINVFFSTRPEEGRHAERVKMLSQNL